MTTSLLRIMVHTRGLYVNKVKISLNDLLLRFIRATPNDRRNEGLRPLRVITHKPTAAYGMSSGTPYRVRAKSPSRVEFFNEGGGDVRGWALLPWSGTYEVLSVSLTPGEVVVVIGDYVSWSMEKETFLGALHE